MVLRHAADLDREVVQDAEPGGGAARLAAVWAAAHGPASAAWAVADLISEPDRAVAEQWAALPAVLPEIGKEVVAARPDEAVREPHPPDAAAERLALRVERLAASAPDAALQERDLLATAAGDRTILARGAGQQREWAGAPVVPVWPEQPVLQGLAFQWVQREKQAPQAAQLAVQSAARRVLQRCGIRPAEPGVTVSPAPARRLDAVLRSADEWAHHGRAAVGAMESLAVSAPRPAPVR